MKPTPRRFGMGMLRGLREADLVIEGYREPDTLQAACGVVSRFERPEARRVAPAGEGDPTTVGGHRRLSLLRRIGRQLLGCGPGADGHAEELQAPALIRLGKDQPASVRARPEAVEDLGGGIAMDERGGPTGPSHAVERVLRAPDSGKHEHVARAQTLGVTHGITEASKRDRARRHGHPAALLIHADDPELRAAPARHRVALEYDPAAI